jgi:hypothetical protein
LIVQMNIIDWHTFLVPRGDGYSKIRINPHSDKIEA